MKRKYWLVLPDGAPLRCKECKISDNKSQVKIEEEFGTYHITCLDANWLAEFGDYQGTI